MGTASLIDAYSESRSFETRYGSRIAIVGGGMLGTILALRYGQAGRIVTLFEASERAERRGHASIASADRQLVNVLDELDLAQTVRWGNARAFGLRFGALAGGQARIVEALRDRARMIDVDVRLGTPVRAIHTDGSGFSVDTGADIGEFDQVIVTVPSPIASKLVPALPSLERSALDGAAYVGIVNVSFVLERPIRQQYISRVLRGGDQFTLINPAALDERSERRTVAYVSRPVGSKQLLGASDREIVESFARALPGNAHIVSARVMRVPHAFAVRQVGSFSSSIPGLTIVNAAHMGTGRHHLERTASLATNVFRTLCAERIG